MPRWQYPARAEPITFGPETVTVDRWLGQGADALRRFLVAASLTVAPILPPAAAATPTGWDAPTPVPRVVPRVAQGSTDGPVTVPPGPDAPPAVQAPHRPSYAAGGTDAPVLPPAAVVVPSYGWFVPWRDVPPQPALVGTGGTDAPVLAAVAPDIRVAVRTYLLADPTLSGLIGPRYYSERIPESATYPNIRGKVISNPRVPTLGGAGGVSVARFRFDCFGRLQADAINVKVAVENLLDGMPGPVALSGIVVLWAHQVSEHDEDEWPEDAADTDLYWVPVEYMIKYRCSIPFTG